MRQNTRPEIASSSCDRDGVRAFAVSSSISANVGSASVRPHSVQPFRATRHDFRLERQLCPASCAPRASEGEPTVSERAVGRAT